MMNHENPLHWSKNLPAKVWVPVILSVIVIVGTLYVSAIRQPYGHRRGSLVAATSDTKSLFLCLLEFQEKHGSFPDAKTHREFTGEKSTEEAPQSSNAFLSQLIAADLADEHSFALGQDRSNIVENGKLDPGECSFAYLMIAEKIDNEWVERGLTLSDNGNYPLLISVDPIDKNRHVVLQIDYSVSTTKAPRSSKSLEDLFPHNPEWFNPPADATRRLVIKYAE